MTGVQTCALPIFLADHGVNIQAISTSEIKVSCLVATKYTELVVRALHDGFGLGGSEPAA